MVVTTPLRPVTKIIFSLLYSLKSQNSLRSDSWLFKLFLAVGKKLFFLRHRANAPLSPPSLPCREVTVVLSGSRQRNYFTVKVKSSAYGKPPPSDQVNARHAGSQSCREVTAVKASRPVRPRSAYRLFCEKGGLDRISFSWRRGVGLLIGALGLLR